jgi:hypothetical protein
MNSQGRVGRTDPAACRHRLGAEVCFRNTLSDVRFRGNSGKYLLVLSFSQVDPKRKLSGTACYEECFNGDGAVVSYLNNVRRTKETTMNLCHEAVDVADREWTRKFVQEPADHKDVAAPDDLSVVLGFSQMLSGGGNEDEVSRLATDRGWLDASGQLTAAGDQLARALLQQSGTRTIFRVW